MEKKITIGLFNDAFYPAVDGVVMVVDNYARILSKMANVIVFVPDYKKEYDDSIFPYKVVRVKSVKIPTVEYTYGTPRIDRNFYREIRKYKLDIIHVHSPFSIGSAAINYARRNHIPVICTMHSQHKQDLKAITHSDLLSNLGTKKLIKIYDKCDECWAVNKGVANLFYEEYGYHTIPRVMPTAVEMEYVKDTEKAHAVINKIHNLKENDKVFLFVGRLTKVKNIFFIVDVIEKLERLKLNFDYKMIFVGIGPDGEHLKKYVKSKHLDKKIIFAGKVIDRELLSYYYSRCDLFLFPSMYDTNSLVQKEAASQKKPTIYLKDAITAYDIVDNETGFISENNPTLYADKIVEVLNDEKLYNKVSRNAYKKVYRTWDYIVKESFKLYLEWIYKYRK